MKQFGILMIGWISFMGMIFSAGATTTPEPTLTPDPGDCLRVTTISDDNIGISWNKGVSCFDGYTSFVVELVSTTCKTNHECTDSQCQIKIGPAECYPPPFDACSDVTFSVTGIGSSTNESHKLLTQAAPWIKPSEWHMKSNITKKMDSTLTLYASWGPPDNTDSHNVVCATKVHVSVTCIGVDAEITTPEDPLGLSSPGEGNVNLALDECQPGGVDLTITYMSGDNPTETSFNSPLEIKGPTTITTESIATEPITTSPAFTGSSEKTENPTEPQPSLSGGEIAGIVIGSCAGVGLICGGIYCYHEKKLFFKK